MRVSMVEILSYICVVLMVVISKTVYGGFLYQNIFLLLTSAALMALCFLRKRIVLYNIRIFSVFTFLLFLPGFIRGGENYLFCFKTAFLFGICCLFCDAVGKGFFIRTYVQIMIAVCLISLFFYGMELFLPQLVADFSSSVVSDHIYYVLNPVYTFSVNEMGFFESNIRNSGPFWEPGGFQGFICIAVLLILFYDNLKWRGQSLLILLITVVTTKSTTGYLITGIVLLAFHKEILGIYGGNTRRNRRLMGLLYAVLGTIAVFQIVDSPIVRQKLSDGNISFQIRRKDFLHSLQMIQERFLWGYGAGETRQERLYELKIVRNSNGLFHLLYTHGIVFGGYYLFRFYKGMVELFGLYEGKLRKLAVSVIFVILLTTEGLCYLPFYLLFLCSADRRERRLSYVKGL